MVWYDPLFIIFGIIGVSMILFGSYHGQGTMKTGLIGWILIIILLIIRASIWLGSML